jgi:hypothetical protein
MLSLRKELAFNSLNLFLYFWWTVDGQAEGKFILRRWLCRVVGVLSRQCDEDQDVPSILSRCSFLNNKAFNTLIVLYKDLRVLGFIRCAELNRPVFIM